MKKLPAHQYAVQLIGPDRLILNTEKALDRPGPYQVLARVEAVGLCFSDLKLLKQFDQHARKGEVLEGISPDILAQIPSYCPHQAPTAPGHEAVCTIVAVGDRVTRHRMGERVLIQTDYRWLKTAAANAAFGYNFEGALQEYVLLDERVFVDPATDESFLVPVPDALSAAGVALVEPWACVESSYILEERRTLKPRGRLLVAADKGRTLEGLQICCTENSKPVFVTACGLDAAQLEAVTKLGVETIQNNDLQDLPAETFDDIIYFGCQKQVIEILNDKLAQSGLINIVLGGHAIGAPVAVGVGRVHYSMTRWIGTNSNNAAASYNTIPTSGEIRDNDRIAVIGAAGPMGQMHVIRLICTDKTNTTLVATDIDNTRLHALSQKTATLAHKQGTHFELLNTQEHPLTGTYNYFAVMVPQPSLVASAITQSSLGILINIFAGIPAHVKYDLDLDTYITNQCYMFGSSGSRLIDMKIVLDKTISGQLNTNLSVDAVSGMAGALDGIKAVENRTLAGKIVVYPTLKDMPLICLADLQQRYPSIAAKLDGLTWTKEAETELFRLLND